MATRGRPRAFDRDHALRTAMLAFWARGYESVSTTELAGSMGISQSSLYAAFGDKQSLFREAVAYYGEHEGAIARRALTTSDTARQAVETMLRQSADRFTDRSLPSGCMVVLAATNATAGNAAVQEFASELRRRDEAALSARLARAVTEGELPGHADPGALAAYYHSVLYGLSIHARDGRDRPGLHAIVDLAMKVWPT
ncbi:TetR/AcrR family transcriptional regulator [Saccharothrix sp.]|uniref:TetR/AcrR family transcriptional regulator n=1 Tax=Saccharothrix sp. TaxID=1873460 RepID=UPI002812087A|nr:TetR/AcrR family transcriptional regulator [Saccharothrix sp.]